MSETAKVVITTTVGGSTLISTMIRTDEDANGVSLDMPAGLSATLTTRTSGTAGVFTALPTGHGITTASILSIYFDAGVAYNCTVSAVTSTTVTVATAAGTAFPAAASTVIISPQVSHAKAITGDSLSVLTVTCVKRCFVNFRSSVPASLLLHQITAGEGRNWFSGSDLTNPLAGVTVATIHVSNGSTVATTVEIGILRTTN